ncbi:MAG: S41 family peptidase [Rikenellaceae bacterium]|nr:S41 family peptidase [Rikenellaceae bacterium]
MSGERRQKIIATLLVVATMATTIWIGILIGRKYEIVRTRNMMSQLANGADPDKLDIDNEYKAYLDKIESFYVGGDKVLQTVSAIRRDYIEDVDPNMLYDKAISGMLSALDPHSEYIPARDFDAVNESLEGEFDGIGIVFNAATDTISVLNVIPQGPSDKAGVRAGDRVVRIDDRDVAGQGIPQDSMVRLMRGPRGSHVKLSIKRRGVDKLVDVNVVRDAIEVHSIETAFIIDKRAKIGFIRLSQFSRTSHDEICSAISKLRGQGMKSLILDLRSNSGGYLDQAILIANEFLPTNKLIVYTEDKYGLQQRTFSRGNGSATELPLVIIVDELSASSSEILAGAIQDNDRGLVIGRRTFGKGLVQAQIPFGDGSAMRLTVARYYTPTGRCIQKPYKKGEGMAYEMEIVDRYIHNEFFSADSIHFDDSMKFTTPGGRTVYGGGGIMPDIFIPLDTVGITPYYNKVWNTNTLFRYTLDFADRHRAELDAVKSLDDLDALYNRVNLVEEFVDYAEDAGIETNTEELAESYDIIHAQLRAYIGRNAMSDESGFYYNIYPIDDAVKRAVKELKK